MDYNLTNKALIMAIDVLFKEKIPVLYMDSNISNIEIVQIIISIKSGVNLAKIKSGSLGTEDLENMVNVIHEIYEAPMYILDCSIENIELIKQLINEKGIRKMFIDYEEKYKEYIDEIKRDTIIPIVAIIKK